MLRKQQQTIRCQVTFENEHIIMFELAQLLGNWREQRPSNENDLDSNITREFGRVYYMG
jgi:hypothetical protein